MIDRLVSALSTHLETGEPPRLPDGSRPLWDAFCALSEARTSSANGPNPIAWSEILAWSQLMRWPLEPHHVEAIRRLDTAWLAHIHGKRTGTARPTSAVTPAGFDAIFG